MFIIVINIASKTEEDEQANKVVNYYIVARYIFFALSLLGCIFSCAPLMKLWTIRLFPERVESKSQKLNMNKMIEQERLIKKKPKDVNNDVVQNPVVNIDYEDKIIRRNINMENDADDNNNGLNNKEDDDNQKNTRTRFGGMIRRKKES